MVSHVKKTSVVMAAIKDNNKQIIYRFSLVSKSSNFSKSKMILLLLLKVLEDVNRMSLHHHQ